MISRRELLLTALVPFCKKSKLTHGYCTFTVSIRPLASKEGLRLWVSLDMTRKGYNLTPISVARLYPLNAPDNTSLVVLPWEPTKDDLFSVSWQLVSFDGPAPPISFEAKLVLNDGLHSLTWTAKTTIGSGRLGP